MMCSTVTSWPAARSPRIARLDVRQVHEQIRDQHDEPAAADSRAA